MKRFILQFLLILLLGFLSQFTLGWNGVATAALVGGMVIFNKGLGSFVAGFFAIGLLWFGLAWQLDSANQSLLSAKVIQILGLGSSLQLVLLTGVLGGLVGGFSSLTGSLFVALFKKEKKSTSPYH